MFITPSRNQCRKFLDRKTVVDSIVARALHFINVTFNCEFSDILHTHTHALSAVQCASSNSAVIVFILDYNVFYYSSFCRFQPRYLIQSTQIALCERVCWSVEIHTESDITHFMQFSMHYLIVAAAYVDRVLRLIHSLIIFIESLGNNMLAFVCV